MIGRIRQNMAKIRYIGKKFQNALHSASGSDELNSSCEATTERSSRPASLIKPSRTCSAPSHPPRYVMRLRINCATPVANFRTIEWGGECVDKRPRAYSQCGTSFEEFVRETRPRGDHFLARGVFSSYRSTMR